MQNVVRIAPGLPPKPQEMTSNGVAQYPGWTPQDIALGVFAFESFIEVPISPGYLSCRCSANGFSSSACSCLLCIHEYCNPSYGRLQ